MHTYRLKQIGFILVLIILCAVTAIAQENQPPSQEELQEFLDQYVSALQEGNTQKAEELVRENREHASIVAEFLLNQGKKAYRIADYETALTMLMLSQRLNQQLGNKEGNAVTLLGLGAIYQATGAYQQALKSYQESLTIFKAIARVRGQP